MSAARSPIDTIREALALAAAVMRGLMSDPEVTRRIDLTPEIEGCERALAALTELEQQQAEWEGIATLRKVALEAAEAALAEANRAEQKWRHLADDRLGMHREAEKGRREALAEANQWADDYADALREAQAVLIEISSKPYRAEEATAAYFARAALDRHPQETDEITHRQDNAINYKEIERLRAALDQHTQPASERDVNPPTGSEPRSNASDTSRSLTVVRKWLTELKKEREAWAGAIFVDEEFPPLAALTELEQQAADVQARLTKWETSIATEALLADRDMWRQRAETVERGTDQLEHALDGYEFLVGRVLEIAAETNDAQRVIAPLLVNPRPLDAQALAGLRSMPTNDAALDQHTQEQPEYREDDLHDRECAR